MFITVLKMMTAREGVTLVNSQLEVDGVGPRLDRDDSCESIIDVGQQVN